MERIKNINLFLNSPIEFAENLGKRGEDIVSVNLGHKRFKYVFCPHIAHKILTSPDFFRPNKAIFDRIKPVTGEKGLVQLQGKDSQELREKIIPELIGKEALLYVQKIVHKNTLELIDELNLKEISFFADISPLMTKLILRSAFEMFLGVDLEKVGDDIVSDYLRLNELSGERMRSLFALPLYTPTKKNLEIQKLKEKLRTFVSNHLKRNGTTPLLRVLKDDKNIIDHCMTFLFAGHETMAASLSFSFLKLANNKNHQEEIRKAEKPYVTSLYKEALRLYPPAYMLVREVTQEESEYGFSKGEQIIIPLTSIHKNEKFFENASTFKPRRFMEQKITKGAFIPFGIGPKDCVGKALAYIEAGVVLPLICQHFDLERDKGHIKSSAYITLHPDLGQEIKFTRRCKGKDS